VLLESDENMAGPDRQTDSEILERTKQETKKPELYKVLLLNDDYTTMDFVIEVLETIFHKQPAEAFRIMMMVHTQGKGLCGVYPHEVAETKVGAVVESARDRGFPLRAAMEPE
jgi:ATP-dependent Clp protease adaptor protein ClpS